MRRTNVVATFFAFVLMLGLLPAAAAQVKTGPKAPVRDPELEKQARINLEAGQFYLKSRKAYNAALDRLKEILTTYPEFSRIDQVYFYLGETYKGLAEQAEKQGKQPEATTHRAEAVKFYKQLLQEFPDGELEKDTKKRLKELGAATS